MSFYLKDMSNDSESKNLYTLVCATVLKASIANIDLLVYEAEETASLLGQAIVSGTDLADDVDIYTIDQLLKALKEKANLNQNQYEELLSFNKHYILGMALLILQSSIYSSQDFDITYVLDSAKSVYNRREYILKYLQIASDYEHSRLPIKAEEENVELNIYDYYKTVHTPQNIFQITSDATVTAQLQSESGRTSIDLQLDLTKQYNDIFLSEDLPDKFYISSLAFTAARYAHTLVHQLRNVGVQRCFLFNSFEHLEEDSISEISSLSSIYTYNTESAALNRKEKIFNSAINAKFIARNFINDVTIDQTTMEKDLFKEEIRNSINYIAKTVECSYEIRDEFEIGYINEDTGELDSFYIANARSTSQYLLYGHGTYGNNQVDNELKALNNKRQFIGYNESSTRAGLQVWYDRAMRRLMSDAHSHDVQESIASYSINLAMTENPKGTVKYCFNNEINGSFAERSDRVYNNSFKLNRNINVFENDPDAAWNSALTNLVSDKFSESLLVSGLSETVNKYYTSISLDIFFGYIFSQKTAKNEIPDSSLNGMISPLLQIASNIHKTYTAQNNEYSKEQYPFLERYYTNQEEGAKARISFVDNYLVNVDYRELEKEIRNTLNMNLLLEAYCKNKDDSLKTIVNKAWCLISDFLLLHKQSSANSDEAGNFGKNRSSFSEISDAAKSHVDSLTFKKTYLQSSINSIFTPNNGMMSVMKVLDSHSKFYNNIETSYKSLLLKIFSKPIDMFDSINRVGTGTTVTLKDLQNEATINREFVTHKISGNTYTGRTTLLDIYNSEGSEEINDSDDIILKDVYRRPTRKVFIYPGYNITSYRISGENFTWDDFSFNGSGSLNTKYVTPDTQSIKLAYYEKLFAMPSVKYDASSPAFYTRNQDYESTLQIKPYYIGSDLTKQYIDIDKRRNYSTLRTYGSISRRLYAYGFNAIPVNMNTAETQTGGYFSKNILTVQYKDESFKMGISRRYKLLDNAHRMYTNSYIAGIATSLRPTFFTFTPDRLIDDETRIDVSGMNQEWFKICSEEKLIKYVAYDGDGLTDPDNPISTYAPIWRKGSDNNYYNALHPYALPPLTRDDTSYNQYSLETYTDSIDVTSYDATCGFMTMLDAVQTGCGNLLYSFSQDEDEDNYYENNYIYKNIFDYNTNISRNIVNTDELFIKNTLFTENPSLANLDELKIYKSKIIIGLFLHTDRQTYFNNILKPILDLILTDYVKLQKNYYNVYVFNKQDFIRRGSPNGLSITNFSSAHGIYQIEKIVNNFYEQYTVQNFTTFNEMSPAEFETFCQNYIDALEAVRSSQSVHVSEQVMNFLRNFDIDAGQTINNVKNLNSSFNTLMTSCALEMIIDYIEIAFTYAIDSVNRKVQANVGKLKSDLIRQIYDNFLKIDILREKILNIAEQTVENFYKQIVDLIDEFEPIQKTFDEMYNLDEFKVLQELFKWKGKNQ